MGEASHGAAPRGTTRLLRVLDKQRELAKSQVLAYMNGRGERESIINPAALSTVSVTTAPGRARARATALPI
jgi:hypothetical protein